MLTFQVRNIAELRTNISLSVDGVPSLQTQTALRPGETRVVYVSAEAFATVVSTWQPYVDGGKLEVRLMAPRERQAELVRIAPSFLRHHDDAPLEQDDAVSSKRTIHARASVGVVTALPKERAAMKLMLENAFEWQAPGKGAGRRFLVGEIPSLHGGNHVVALALMSDMGNNQSAITACKLATLLPGIRHIVMSGIAGGVPRPGVPEHDVRLGDIVVSDRNGVVQYDLVKQRPDGSKEYRHPPRPPGPELLDAVRHLRADEEMFERPWEAYLLKGQAMKKGTRPEDNINAKGEPIEYPPDPERVPGRPRVFYGTIAASNTLLKYPDLRDHLGREFGVKAVEMEASGIADATWNEGAGYLVVRGICDYCDENKGDYWQSAAAVAAASYVRALIASMHVEDDPENPT